MLPYSLNLCYHIYLKLTEVNELATPVVIIMHKSIFLYQQELLLLSIILALFNMSKSSISLKYFVDMSKAILNTNCVKPQIRR